MLDTFKMLTLVIILWVASLGEPKVTINNGQIIMEGETSCIKNANGKETTYFINDKPTGLFFSLITYNCTTSTGVIISKLSCKSCGIYCNYNQLIEGCESFWWPMFIGVLISLIIMSLIIGTTRRYILARIGAVIEYFVYRYQRARDNKELNKVMKMKKRNIMTVRPRYKQSLNTVQCTLR